MNFATIVIGIAVAALIIWAIIKTIKNRGKCSGCSCNCNGNCNGRSDGCGSHKEADNR